MIFRLLYYSYFNSKVYFLLLTFVMVENTKTGSETKSLIPNTLTALSGNSIAIILAPANIIVAIPVTNKLIDHIILIIFEFIFCLRKLSAVILQQESIYPFSKYDLSASFLRIQPVLLDIPADFHLPQPD